MEDKRKYVVGRLQTIMEEGHLSPGWNRPEECAQGFVFLSRNRGSKEVSLVAFTVGYIHDYPSLQMFFAVHSAQTKDMVQLRAKLKPATPISAEESMHQMANSSLKQAFHKAFGTSVGVRRPNLWLFITVLKDRQAVSENSFEAARRGQPAPRRRRKWRILEDRLTTLKEEYNNGDRTLDEYWGAVSYLVHR